MKTNYHTHTTRCLHATGSDESYVLSAIRGGYKELGFSDHTPWKREDKFRSIMRMDVEEFPFYVKSIRGLREKYKENISLKIGLECEYFKDKMSWLKELIQEYQLDYVIFGNHFYGDEKNDFFFDESTLDKHAVDLYVRSAIEGMETGLYAYLAHPELFTRSYLKQDDACIGAFRSLCRAAKQMSVPIEYNLAGCIYNEKYHAASYPHPKFWEIAAQEGCTAIIGVDAHNNLHLETDKYYLAAQKQLSRLGIATIDTIPFFTY